MTPIDIQCRPALARGVRVWTDPITGTPVLLFPEGVLPLDDTTHDIVIRCSGNATLEAIVASLAEEYDADREVLLADVSDCLAELRDEMLVTIAT